MVRYRVLNVNGWVLHIKEDRGVDLVKHDLE